MRNLKNENGITLVALVVTIIVLLILAGVSLSLVAGGNGIITKAGNAVDTNDLKATEEQVNLEVAALMEEFYEAKYVSKTDSSDNLLDYISNKHSTTGFSAGNYTVTVSSAGAVSVKNSKNEEVYTATMSDKGAITGFVKKAAATPSTPSTSTP